MTLLLKPVGRGNWTPLRLDVPRQRDELMLPIEAKAGKRVTIDGKVFRIAKVLP